MEVLSINVVHEVWFLMEFIHVEIFDSQTYKYINMYQYQLPLLYILT